jgi:hypothetical protein
MLTVQLDGRYRSYTNVGNSLARLHGAVTRKTMDPEAYKGKIMPEVRNDCKDRGSCR